MKALSVPICRWHKQHFGDMTERIKRFQEEIKKVDDMVSSGHYDGTMEARKRALVRCCKKWYVRQDVYWKQMSRSRHAHEMDRNTKYFHNIALTRRRNNRIESLEINGRIVKNQARIKIAIRDFYKCLYHQEGSPSVSFRDGLVNRLEREEAEGLEVIPSVEEVKEAVWDCESSKALGSDVYNMNFIKMCWNEIEMEFTAAVISFFETARLPAESNITWVALAPKFVGTKEIKDLRPISMVGYVYKVISKFFTRRMRRVMPGLVGESQTAFVKGRKIHDGALIACETRRWASVEHEGHGLESVLARHLYPFWIIENAVKNGRISSLLFGRDNIELSHLQFADDTILFCPSEENTVRNYQRLLRCFEIMSRLSINFEKSNLIPVNCSQEWVSRMCQLLGCQEAALPVRYLGINLGANPRLVKTWKPVLDKVEEKLSLWKAKVLSKAGKLVLIKSVINSLPIYYLSLYKMPNMVARRIIALQRKFFWGKDDGRPGMALVKWEIVQAPKKLGGLGVGDAVVRNTALLFKW
ncbi:uncharacterized protein LOC107627320 [Arachis ipaensis]|uniref:uncharacterized protein LOC107627320 n=1 Tax=Arachis ipaensis TaxID=130454 RepID=UPI0007AF4F36|nr:uncharacterized protein LOC107627320 [Arachis ipaensis]XP_025636050.1 uncharacterized protein LOC112730163 [Arachis hypogaea]